MLLRLIARSSALCLAVGIGLPAYAQPVLPCDAGRGAMVPAYGGPGDPPAARTWRDIDLPETPGCAGLLAGPAALAVALAGRFDGTLSLGDIATRLGAVSAIEGLAYWSVTDRRWRTLVSRSYAVDGPETRRPRPDFSVQEILSGRTLYFAQNDTRSTGLNIYRMAATAVAADRLTIEIVNVTPIRFTLVTLFEAEALRSIHFIDRLNEGGWGYYGLSLVRSGAVAGHEKSFVNRAAALYRHLAGLPPTAEPPLAP